MKDNTPYRFAADTAALRKLCDATLGEMRRVRTPHEPLWRDIAANFDPDIGKALDDGNQSDRSAERNDGQIQNSEPRILLHRLAAGLQSGITNQSQRWFALAVPDKTVAQRGGVRRWMSEAGETVSMAMADSNLYPTLNQKYLHLGACGTACSIIVRGDAPGEVHLELSDIGDFWIAEDRRRRVDTVVRRIRMTARRIVDEFGAGWCPDSIRDAADGQRQSTEHEVFNLIAPNSGRAEFSDAARGRPFVSVYWLDQKNTHNDGILAVRSFSYNPIAAPRWQLAGGPYGSGCGKTGLADAKELQTLERDKMQIVAQESTPTVLAPASLKGETILDSYPGGVVWYPDGSARQTASPVGRLFDTRQGVAAVLESIAKIENRLGRIFYADLFAMMLQLTAQQPKTMTAREVNELSSEKIALLGPVLTQLNVDLLDRVTEAFFVILFEDGMFPDPPEELKGLPISVTYQSMLHAEQVATTKMRGIIKVLDIVSMVARIKPEAADKFDADQTIDEVCASLPESAAVILDDADVDKIRAARAEQQAAMASAEAAARLAPGIGRGVRDMAEAKLGNGSALDAAAQQMGVLT